MVQPKKKKVIGKTDARNPSSDRVPDELWIEVHDIVQETRIKTIPMEKKSKKKKKKNGCLGRTYK